MNRFFLLLLLLFCLFSSLAFGQIVFENAPSHANDLPGSKALVYFTSEQCIGCEMMEKSTFQKLKLPVGFKAYKLDVNSAQAAAWVEEFDICCLPGFLFFDENGKPPREVAGAMPSAAFIKLITEPESVQPPAPDQEILSEYDNETVVMEEMSFDETKSIPSEAEKGQFLSEEILAFTEKPTSEASRDQAVGEFLYHLRKHVAKMEESYIAGTISEEVRLQDLLSGASLENDDSEALYESIQELKDWEFVLSGFENKFEKDAGEVKMIPETVTEAPAPVTSTTTALESYALVGGYQIQCGFFNNEKYAERMAADLKNSYLHPVEIQVEDHGGEVFYRVVLGNFADKSAAKKAFRQLKRDGRKALLKKP